MNTDTDAKEKLEGLLRGLALSGHTVREVSKKPQVYSIDGHLVNIRSRGKLRRAAEGDRQFWYSVAFSVLEKVQWVIFMTTEANYFVMLPSDFLDSLKDRMYPDRSTEGLKGVFDIDWDQLEMVLRGGERVSINDYYQNLDEFSFPT